LDPSLLVTFKSDFRFGWCDDIICRGGQNINIRRETEITVAEICIAVDLGGIWVAR
jgi:hypothetical protein